MTRSLILNARKVLLISAASFALAAQAQTSTTTSPAAGAATSKDGSPAQSAFLRADANKDGKLSKEESARMPAIAAKFSELDADKDGNLSITEFAVGYGADK